MVGKAGNAGWNNQASNNGSRSWPLTSSPGVGRAVAETLVAELGVDLTRFPSAKHLASWAGLCPGNHESAGTRRGGATRKGSPWLRSCLVQAAHAAAAPRAPIWRPSTDGVRPAAVARRRPWLSLTPS